jgi:hypothetical protein
MLVIGRPAGHDRDAELVDGEAQPSQWSAAQRVIAAATVARLRSRHSELFPPQRHDNRAFPDVRWMEISSVLRRELEAGRDPDQIRQIDFDGEPLDMASVLRWRRKILEGWRG